MSHSLPSCPKDSFHMNHSLSTRCSETGHQHVSTAGASCADTIPARTSRPWPCCPPRLFPRHSQPLHLERLRGGTSPRQGRARAAPPRQREGSRQHRAALPGKHGPARPGPATQDSRVVLPETRLEQSPKAEKISLLAARNLWQGRWPWERVTQPLSCHTAS